MEESRSLAGDNDVKYAFIFYRKYFIVCIPLLGTQAIQQQHQQQVQAQKKNEIDRRDPIQRMFLKNEINAEIIFIKPMTGIFNIYFRIRLRNNLKSLKTLDFF